MFLMCCGAMVLKKGNVNEIKDGYESHYMHIAGRSYN